MGMEKVAELYESGLLKVAELYKNLVFKVLVSCGNF
jgi:hypothetical protein